MTNRPHNLPHMLAEKNEPRVKVATAVASQNTVFVILVLSLVVLLISRAISGM